MIIASGKQTESDTKDVTLFFPEIKVNSKGKDEKRKVIELNNIINTQLGEIILQVVLSIHKKQQLLF